MQTVELVIFYLYLMFHACAVRFDMTENLKKIQNFLETKQGLGSEFCEELTQDVSPMYPI